jgi:hypothetical protein
MGDVHGASQERLMLRRQLERAPKQAHGLPPGPPSDSPLERAYSLHAQLRTFRKLLLRNAGIEAKLPEQRAEMSSTCGFHHPPVGSGLYG